MKKLLPLYRFGLGGKLGSGEQWVSWVALSDLICALEYILEHLVRELLLKSFLHQDLHFVFPLWKMH